MTRDADSRFSLGVTAVMLHELDFEQQLALCRELGVTHYVYRPRVIGDKARGQPTSDWGNHRFDLTPRRLLEEGPRLRVAVEGAGLVPFATVPRLTADADDQALALHFDGAAAAGAARVRVNPPAYPKEAFDFEAYLAQTIGHYQRAAVLAKTRGVKPVIEMHGGTSACGPGLARWIVREFDPAELGVILDLPNAVKEGYVEPRLAVSAVGPWIDHLHVGGARRTEGRRDERGFRLAGARVLRDAGLGPAPALVAGAAGDAGPRRAAGDRGLFTGHDRRAAAEADGGRGATGDRGSLSRDIRSFARG